MRNVERKTHYKMYKSHKGWLVAGITVTSMAVGIIAGPQATPTAQAADNAPATEAASDQTAGDQPQEVALKSAKSVSGTTGDGAVDDGSGIKDDVNNDGALKDGSSTSGNQQASEAPANDATETPTTGQGDAGNTTPAPKVQGNGGSGVAETPGTPEAENENIVPADATLNVATPAEAPATVQTGITVQNPDNLTDKVTGQPVFNVSKTQRLQYTYDHTDADGVSTDLRAYNGYSAKYQAQGAGTWLGETYANNIAQDAKGMDVNSPLQYSDGTRPLYIDEWMPDSGLQYFLWQSNFAKKYATISDFRNNFTKAELATVTSISSNELLQSVNGAGKQYTSYYMALMSMTTLEGLQNATNLQTLYLQPALMVSINTFGNGFQSGNLWDIRALSNLSQLRSVDITLFSVNDISALSNKDQLTEVNMPYNQITDISPLATDKNLNIKTGTSLFNQHILLAPITVSTKLAPGQSATTDGALTYTTPSFIIKDLGASNLPIKGFDNAGNTKYPSLFPSSADAGNVNSNTLSWYNLQVANNGNYGSLSTTWADPNSDFAGYIIQPYDLAENVSDLNVNVQLLQADGQQLTLAPSTLISGEVGSDVNVQSNATIMSFLNQQLSKGYTFSGLILDGTGLYSDYLAGNGKATAQPSWTTTLTDASKNWTILFYKDVLPWNLAVSYGTEDATGNFTPITTEDGMPVTDSYSGTSDTPLALNGYQKDFPDYVYTGAETSTDGQTWTDISSATDIPFVGAKQAVRMVYAQAKRATVTVKDATTGKTIQVLDYTTNPELRGAIGTTSTFDSAAIIDPEVAKGYTLVSDTTKNADGTSAIVFGQADDTNLAFTITLAHAFKTTEKAVNETITYQDQQQKQVANPVTQTMTFATVTDQVTQDAVTYSNAAATGTPELDVTGQPTDPSWVVYQTGDALTFAGVKNPAVTGMHVVSTTDSANDLTQTTAQAVTPDSADLSIVVTYAANTTTGGGGDTGGEVTPPTEPGNKPATKPATGGNGVKVADKVKPKAPAKQPEKKPTGKVVKKVTTSRTGGQAVKVTSQPLASGQAAKVQKLAEPVKSQSAATLPQTDERQQSGLAVMGLLLLGALVGTLGWKKREH
ncbi:MULTISPECIES: LPXTG cell wall anchor domain-containing protein [Lactobacillaceae]|uniref:mucin-binding protein n=1 Tax=Lactobacillaceae TaxID=33958 RepID=UPI0014569724|nr:LPXTG cell wall anchor domain-containing protein [Lactobacillus sp. HBUAS51381]NLR08866.1 LPXTG cell wall anchor domain-containing protein [Lactobacillus sp. HBUAS51381]